MRRTYGGILLQFPELKSHEGEVSDSLAAPGVSEEARQVWEDLVDLKILPEDEDAGF